MRQSNLRVVKVTDDERTTITAPNPDSCPNIGIYGYRCRLCGAFHYPAWQLELYETCDVCGAIRFGHTTGLRNRPHKACRKSIDRWPSDPTLSPAVEATR